MLLTIRGHLVSWLPSSYSLQVQLVRCLHRKCTSLPSVTHHHRVFQSLILPVILTFIASVFFLTGLAPQTNIAYTNDCVDSCYSPRPIQWEMSMVYQLHAAVTSSTI